MPLKRKDHYILLKVKAPADMSTSDVRREVRTLINEQCNHIAEPEDIRATKVSAAPSSRIGNRA